MRLRLFRMALDRRELALVWERDVRKKVLRMQDALVFGVR